MKNNQKHHRPKEWPQCFLSESEKDELALHILRCRGFFGMAIERIDEKDLDPLDDMRPKLIVKACKILSEGGLAPSQKAFRRRLEQQINNYNLNIKELF